MPIQEICREVSPFISYSFFSSAYSGRQSGSYAGGQPGGGYPGGQSGGYPGRYPGGQPGEYPVRYPGGGQQSIGVVGVSNRYSLYICFVYVPFCIPSHN